MPTTPEQIADLISGYTDLKGYFETLRTNIESDRASLQKSVNGYIADAAQHLPVTPNLLVDTKHFNDFCDGQFDVEVEAVAAHGAPWTSFWYSGSSGEATIKRVLVTDMEEKEGIPWGGDLALATNGPAPSRPYYGTNFTVLILDVTISNTGTEQFFVMCQGCPQFTGWSKGQFRVQASNLYNVIEHSGNIAFGAQANMSPRLNIHGSDLGQGWIYKQVSTMGFGGCHQPRFFGEGHMKVAIALPYVGFGDHQGRFVWAGSVGRYSHFDQVS